MKYCIQLPVLFWGLLFVCSCHKGDNHPNCIIVAARDSSSPANLRGIIDYTMTYDANHKLSTIRMVINDTNISLRTFTYSGNTIMIAGSTKSAKGYDSVTVNSFGYMTSSYSYANGKLLQLLEYQYDGAGQLGSSSETTYGTNISIDTTTYEWQNGDIISLRYKRSGAAPWEETISYWDKLLERGGAYSFPEVPYYGAYTTHTKHLIKAVVSPYNRSWNNYEFDANNYITKVISTDSFNNTYTTSYTYKCD